MTGDLRQHYLDYLTALDERRFEDLRRFVAPELTYNGEPTTLQRYQQERRAEAETIPDLRYDVGLLVVEGDEVAARLEFDCTPTAPFLGREPTGRRIRFVEHVFYRFERGLVVEVRSLLDVDSVRRQLGPATADG